MILDFKTIAALNETAEKLDIPANWLYNEIMKESGFDPKIQNPTPGSSARGLIQFIDSTAQEMGYRDSLQITELYPTAAAQIRKPVYDYLRRYSPFQTNAEFYLSVFRPADRRKNYNEPFSATVQKWNPGIVTPAHYVAFVEGRLADLNSGKIKIEDIVFQNPGFIPYDSTARPEEITELSKKKIAVIAVSGLTLASALYYFLKNR